MYNINERKIITQFEGAEIMKGRIGKGEGKYFKPHIFLWLLVGLILLLCLFDFQSYIRYMDYHATEGYVDELEISGQNNARGSTSYSYTIHWEKDGNTFEKEITKGNFHPDMEAGEVWVNEDNDVIAKNPKSFLAFSLKGLLVSVIIFAISLVLRRIHMNKYPETYYAYMNMAEKRKYELNHYAAMIFLSIFLGIAGIIFLLFVLYFAIVKNEFSLEASEICGLILITAACSGISAKKWNRKK